MGSALEQLQSELQPSRENEGETARRILDTALALYLEFGLRRTSMEDVARRAGVGRVTVYRHYGDKDTLFQAVVLRECRRSMAAILKQLDGIEGVEALFVECFVLVLNGIRHHPLIQRLMETEPEWLLPHLTLQMAPVMTLSQNYARLFFQQQQGNGYFPGLNVDIASEILVRLLQSCVLTPGFMLAPDQDADLRRAAGLLVETLLRQPKAPEINH